MYRQYFVRGIWVLFICLLSAACGGGSGSTTDVEDVRYEIVSVTIAPDAGERRQEDLQEIPPQANCRSSEPRTYNFESTASLENDFTLGKGKVYGTEVHGSLLVAPEFGGFSLGGIGFESVLKREVQNAHGIRIGSGVSNTSGGSFIIPGGYVTTAKIQWYGIWKKGEVTVRLYVKGNTYEERFPYEIRIRREYEFIGGGQEDTPCSVLAEDTEAQGDQYYANGELKKALEAYTEALDYAYLFPDICNRLNLKRSVIYAELGSYGIALDECSQIPGGCSQVAGEIARKADAQFENGDTESAIHYYTIALHFSSDTPNLSSKILVGRARCYLAMKNYSQALSDCREALQYNWLSIGGRICIISATIGQTISTIQENFP